MAEEKKSIFRKESLDRISSPEEYDQYLKVTGPGVWMVLGVVVLLLVGSLCWAVFGRLTTNMPVAVVADGESTLCAVPSEKAEKILSGEMTVTIADQTYALKDLGRAPEMVTEDTDPSVIIAGQLPVGSFVTFLGVDADLESGVYTGQIQIEQVSPIHFILN